MTFLEAIEEAEAEVRTLRAGLERSAEAEYGDPELVMSAVSGGMSGYLIMNLAELKQLKAAGAAAAPRDARVAALNAGIDLARFDEIVAWYVESAIAGNAPLSEQAREALQETIGESPDFFDEIRAKWEREHEHSALSPEEELYRQKLAERGRE